VSFRMFMLKWSCQNQDRKQNWRDEQKGNLNLENGYHFNTRGIQKSGPVR
jgi:hypothetical protein